MADPARRATAARRVLAVALTTVVPFVAACSSTKDLESGARTKTTIRDLGEDLIDDESVAGGSEGERKLQRVMDQLVASPDPCAILTQNGIQGYSIDPTILASSRARQTLTRGVIDVYNHLLDIIPDPAVKPALVVQRDTFVEVLDVVERYTANPSSKQGNEQIAELVKGEEFVEAATSVSSWTLANCS